MKIHALARRCSATIYALVLFNALLLVKCLRPLGAAVCDGGSCPEVHLGVGITDARILLADLCVAHRGYICNRKVTPACEEICTGGVTSGIEEFQAYLDYLLESNPFFSENGTSLQPWVVPQVDLAGDGAFIFMSQRQAAYLYLRMLALKIRYPRTPVVSQENTSTISALEYGLSYGCNWHKGDGYYPVVPACRFMPELSGVSWQAVQGNIFGLLAWVQQLALENGAGLGVRQSCYKEQQGKPDTWCPHDSVIGAVRGGLSGPEAKARFDTDAFWANHTSPLHMVGSRPNVCSFQNSSWVWHNDRDPASSEGFCVGEYDVPDVYGTEVEDFMSVDRPGTLAVDIGGAQYGGGEGSANGRVFSTQDESTPVFYPETVALGFNSKNRSITTGTTALVFLGVRRYFSGQSGSHGVDFNGLTRPLFNHGDSCGSLKYAAALPKDKMLQKRALTQIGDGFAAQMYSHSLIVLTSSCGTCEDGNLPTTPLKFRTAGPTCLVEWAHGRSGCGSSPPGGWTYWMDVWIWFGALRPDFYPKGSQRAFRDLVLRIGTGPWGAGVWWGNTLQYFIVTWLGTALLWDDHTSYAPQLDYYAYGAPENSRGVPLGGFCEQYQAQGYEDVVRKLPMIDKALASRGNISKPVTLRELYGSLRDCSRCDSNCSFPGVGPQPQDVYCTSSCTADFASCLLESLERRHTSIGPSITI